MPISKLTFYNSKSQFQPVLWSWHSVMTCSLCKFVFQGYVEYANRFTLKHVNQCNMCMTSHCIIIKMTSTSSCLSFPPDKLTKSRSDNGVLMQRHNLLVILPLVYLKIPSCLSFLFGCLQYIQLILFCIISFPLPNIIWGNCSKSNIPRPCQCRVSSTYHRWCLRGHPSTTPPSAGLKESHLW